MSTNKPTRLPAAPTSVTPAAHRGLSRRTFLKATGILVVGVSVADPTRLLATPAAHAQQPPPLGNPVGQLDSWLSSTRTAW
jgi:hypothetical protein